MVEQLSRTNQEKSNAKDEDPDLDGFQITGHNLLVMPVEIEGKTKSGLILTDSTREDIAYLMNVCKVLQLGPTAYTQECFKNSGPWCKKGDYVLIPKITGQKVKFKGKPLTIVSCDKVIAVIDDPATVDTNYNILHD